MITKTDRNITVVPYFLWLAEGRRLFGNKFLDWRFVCPGCGHIQSPRDFKQFKSNGATPNSATCQCIGRYNAGKSWLNDNPRKTGGPCDYAAGGLFNICPVKVINGDKEIWTFAFDETSVEKSDEAI
jgi:hypothetical protein